MKIVQLVTQMESGGAQRVAILLHEALLNQGYNSEVWFLYLKRPAYKDFPGVKVLLEHNPSGLDYLKIFNNLHNWLKLHQPDVLISHTHYANVIGQFIARLCNITRRIAVQHNPIQTYPKIARWADWILGNTAFYSANIAVSQVVVDSVSSYPEFYRKRLTKIYNGIPLLENQNSRQQVRTQLGLLEKTPLLVNVGRLAKQKNQTTLIEAMSHLPEAHLLLIGEGELRDELQQKVSSLGLEKQIHFLGELKSEEVLRLLSASDVFVFPSLYEAMPMALVEAMGLGLPIVASDIPAMREVLGDAGIIIPSNSAEEIANGVAQVLNFSEIADKISKYSLERAKLFSIEKMVESYEQTFI